MAQNNAIVFFSFLPVCVGGRGGEVESGGVGVHKQKVKKINLNSLFIRI